MELYSKEVMKHFKDPQNVGKLKNPSAIGKVGNLRCLPPNQNIHINDGMEKINNIVEKQKVLSHDGRYNEVIKIYKRNHAGNIIILKNKLGTIKLTPEHLVFAVKLPKGDKFLRTKNKKNLFAAWYHSEDLKKGDITLYPISKMEKDTKYLNIDIPKSKWDFKSKKIPARVPLNNDLLRLFGYFLAEGHIQDKPSRTFISFAFNINEKEIIKDVQKITKRLFNLNTVIRLVPEKKTAIVDIFSARLARFFKQLFNNGAENKTIPDFIMKLPLRKQRALIYALWKGDGYIQLNRLGPRGGYATISYKLLQQIKILLLRQKIIPSIYEEKEKEVGGVKHKKSYRIHVGQRDSLKKLCDIVGLKYCPKSYASEGGWIDDDYFYTPISSVEKEKYNGKVYNLEILNSHSFVSEAFTLHNCGDIMYLYLKIEKDKKGKEIIKDVKFETFGCTVAIANTSLLTTIIKGKTIEQALKINKNDLLKRFGSIPFVKVHCSMLAVDALAEAIYDYYIKNKKPIPKDLRQRHKTAEKIGKELKERHKELVDLEENLHKS
jgi:nitrogen fixation protein NifU and related proteins